MRFLSCSFKALPLLLILASLPSGSARAASVELVSSDDRGVTLRLRVPEYSLESKAGGDRLRIVAPGLDVISQPGRPNLPIGAALLALPPGATAVARVESVQGEETRDGVKLEIGMKPVIRDDRGGLGPEASMEEVAPIRDGPWPVSPVEVGEPFTVRRQRMVAVHLIPFRYDEAASRVWVMRSLIVRVDFVGGTPTAQGLAPAAEDTHWEPVLQGSVLNYVQGRRWRIRRAPPAFRGESLFPRPGAEGAQRVAFDEDAPEVRVQLDTTGVYAIDYDQLSLHGYPANVPIAEVSVHRHEYIHDPPTGVPPYVTIELPIEVDDRDQDGFFTSGDRILVWVQSWAERSRASWAQRAWGDGEVVYVTRLSGRNGLRMTSRSGALGTALPPLASFPQTEHWEQNRNFIPVFQVAVTDTNSDQFTWTTNALYADRAKADSFRFETHDLDTTHAAVLALTWQGSKATPHSDWAEVRNGLRRFTTVADSVAWVGRGAFTHRDTIFGSALTEGLSNVLRAWGKNTETDNQIVNTAVNYFEVSYWRRFRAIGGMLSCNSAGAVGDYQIQGDRFRSRDIRAYDVTDSLQPVRLALDDSLIVQAGAFYSVRFRDSSPGGATRSYVIFDQPRALAADRYHTVTRRSLTNRAGADYLMIVPEAFLSAVDPLVTLRTAQGLNVALAPLESVEDEFNGGRKSSYAIRRYLRYAYDNWNTQFVLLVGDASSDPQNFLGTSGPDWIPAQQVRGPVGVYDGASNVYESIPSDPWYGWCLDCTTVNDTPGKVPDLFIGRLTVNSLQQATDVINKIVAYANVTPDQTWRRKMELVADDTYSTQSFFGGGGFNDVTYCHRSSEEVFLEINQACQSVIQNEACLPLAEPEIFDLGVFLAGEPADPNDPNCRDSWLATQERTRHSVTPILIQRLNQGTLWWNFQGHANPYVLTHEDLYVNRGSDDDKDLLMNTGKPFLFTAFACHPNTFTGIREGRASVGPSLGEDMLLLPDRGAIASWGSTGYEILPSYGATHLNVHFARALFARRPFDQRLGAWQGRVVLGEAIAKTLLDNLTTTASSLERDVGISYNLLGDPATGITVGQPEIVVTANGQPVTSGEPVRLLTVGDTLRLVADLGSNQSLASISLERTDARGTTVVPDSEYTLTPAFPDTGAAGNGGRCYHFEYATSLELGSFHYTLRTVDKSGVNGTFDIVFGFFVVLKADGLPVVDQDPVSPTTNLALTVISPAPIADPQADFQLTLNGTAQAFSATPANADTSRREWVLTWSHAPYPPGDYRLSLTVSGGFTTDKTFRVESHLGIENALAFPNPFDDQVGTHFSFSLTGDGPTDVMLRVFTVSGRLVYQHVERSLIPGYHQFSWDGLDGEGEKLANGVYLYRLVVHGSQGSVYHEGRLVKLRKPRRRIETVP